MNPHGGGRTADATDPLPVTADVREVGFRKDHGRLRETSFLEKASRGLVGAARRLGLRKGLVTSDGGGGSDDPYEQWIARNERDGGDRAAVQLEIRAWALQPKVSLITLVFNPSRYALTRCLESVLAQVYPHWELCLVDGGSTHDDVRAVIQEYAARDSRIRPLMLPENWGIAGNSNAALKMASGEYVGLLDYDDTLAPVALYDVVKLVNESPEVDLVYSDEDKIAPLDETRFHPIFKPGWSPDTFLSHNFPCHFTVIRKAFVDEVGGFRLGYDGSQDYDLFLRVAQLTNKIQHIPKVLYHWRTSPESAAGDQLAKPYALDAAKRAIGEYLRGQRLDAQVVDGKFPTSYRVRYVIRGRPKVSIIIPTRDKTPLLKRCVSSILARTEYPEFEILIVDNGSTEQAALDYLRALEEDRKIRVMSYDQPFNFSAINNFAVRSVTSDLLLFLNNDTEVVSPEWLSAMLEFAQRDDIGAVGAKLYYYDDTVQHGGVVIGLGGIADHAHRGFPRLSNGYLGRLNVIQNVSAVSAACMMMRRKVFEEVGGFEERLSYCYNDVDLCLKIREKGYLIVFTPYAELYHHESARGGSQGREATSEGRDLVGKEQAFIKDKWRGVLAAGDPYYSPNLTLEKYDFSPRI
jgi:GT2 family glycosyltransferase